MKKFILLILTLLIFSNITYADNWKKFPLNVYITPHPDYMYAKNAFSSWERWTGRKLFNITDSTSADIKVIFEHNINYENAIGLTSRRTNSSTGEILHADITIRMKTIDNAKRHNGRQTYMITAHEIGHALGLEHSGSPMDLMYPNYRDITTVSKNDLNAFYALYGK